jgi:predicted nucleic acid-binding protein
VARYSALLDACVLVPISLADTLLRIAEAGLYRPLWSERILDEMVAAIVAVHPALPSGAARRRASVMQSSFPDATVADWQDLEAGLTLPDPDDRHVVAAALQGRADMIVTANLRDFPADVLDPIGLEVQDPDTFLLNQLDLEPDLTIATLRGQAAATRRPAITTKVLLEHLAKCGVPRFASAAAAQLWREA